MKRAVSSAMLVLAPGIVGAQVNQTQASINSSLWASNNSSLAPAGQEQADIFASLTPRLKFQREGAGLRAGGVVGADLVSSLRNTQRDRVLPSAQVDAESTLVDRLLFLQGDINARQVEANPYGLRAQSGTPQNVRNAAAYSLSPKLAFEFGPGASFIAKHTTSQARFADTDAGDVDSRSTSVRAEMKPHPIGGWVEWQDERTDYVSSTAQDLRNRSLNGALTYSPDIDWVVGGVVGRERVDLSGSQESSTTTGLRVLWSPGPRTAVAAAWDRRFFGNGWQVTMTHRTPFASFSLSSKAEPVSASTTLSRGQSLAGFLDSILTTRNPNAGARSNLVDDLVTRQ